MRSLMIPVCLLALVSILGCIQPAQALPAEPSDAMSFADAKSIAQKSECTKDGNLTDTYFYNDNSRTWWIGLDTKKQGCSPACVVWDNGTAEINWRCTGLIVPNP